MKLKCFGIARELIGHSEITLDGPTSVGQVRVWLSDNYVELHKLNNYMIAVNEEYADDDQQLAQGDVIAVIPPVSGG